MSGCREPETTTAFSRFDPITAPTPPRAMPAYPAMASPGPIDQQKSQSYRRGLSDELRRLDNEGVSPGNERYRELQQQLNRPGGQ